MVSTTPRTATVSPMVRRGWLASAFLLAFLAVGSMHWTLPYSEVSLPNSLMRPALIGVLIAAVLARILGRTGFLGTTLVIGASAPAAIAARVIVDTATDPTSHNLWPFELFLGGFVSTACAAAGSLIALPWVKKARN